MFASRVSRFVFATTVLALTAAALPAEAYELKNVQITSYQLGTLDNDLPKPPNAMQAPPKPGTGRTTPPKAGMHDYPGAYAQRFDGVDAGAPKSRPPLVTFTWGSPKPFKAPGTSTTHLRRR